MVSVFSSKRKQQCHPGIHANLHRGIFFGCGASVFIVMTASIIIVMAVFFTAMRIVIVAEVVMDIWSELLEPSELHR